MNWKRLLGIVTSPYKTFEEIAEERPVVNAAWVLVVAYVSWSWGMKYAHNHGAGKIAEFLANYSAPHALAVGTVFRLNYLFVLVIFALLAIAAGFLRAAVLQLTAEILGGKGRGFSFLAAFGFAHAPLVLMYPLVLAASLLGGGDLGGGTGAVLWYPLSIILHLWTLYAIILCIQATHHMELAEAVKVIVYPIAACCVIAIVSKLLVFLSGTNFVDLMRIGQGG